MLTLVQIVAVPALGALPATGTIREEKQSGSADTEDSREESPRGQLTFHHLASYNGGPMPKTQTRVGFTNHDAVRSCDKRSAQQTLTSI